MSTKIILLALLLRSNEPLLTILYLEKIAEKISTFITNKKPDILSIQEYYK